MKILRHIVTIVITSVVLFSSCESMDELNTDPTRLTEANPGTFLNPILYGMANTNWNKYNDYTFELMQSKVATLSTTGEGWYFISDAAGDGTWTTYYKWLNNISVMEEEAIKLNEPNYQAIAFTLKSWIYEILTDAFGDVPMSEACKGGEKLFTPKFDKQKDIYQTIINDLDSANRLFNTSAGLKYNSSGEFLYLTSSTLVSNVSPGIVKWKKFCNSLRMRVLLRAIDVDGLNAKNELIKMINDPATYPVFESNADAALLAISGVSPQDAPMTRPADFTSYICLSEFFINTLSGWNDPRLPIFATKATNGTVKSFIGWPSGYRIAPSFNASAPNQNLAKAPLSVVFMTYAEIAFIKAELAQKGIITGDAKTFYQNGVTSAITQWGGIVPANYFDNTKAAYDGTLERIMQQKFFALFFCDYQQWFEYNRTSFPAMPVGDGVPAANKMPYRFKYPATLQRTNLKNYQEAKSSMGGDDFNIKLIWQK
jgi:hypothetical protein